jgi:hypothetical protein
MKWNEEIAELKATGVAIVDLLEWDIDPVPGNVMDMVPVLGDGPPTQRARYWFEVGWMLGAMDDVKKEGRPVLRELMREILRQKKRLFRTTPDIPGAIEMLRACVDNLEDFRGQSAHFRETFN